MDQTNRMTSQEAAAIHSGKRRVSTGRTLKTATHQFDPSMHTAVAAAATPPCIHDLSMPKIEMALPLHIPEPDMSVPERGTTGPIPIGEVMKPVQRIIAHPDRNRLMGEFFKRYW